MMETGVQIDELRQQTRAAQHMTSFPLLVIGVLLLNYSTTGFGSTPVAWRYAGALAFVALWGLGKANEYATGVGRGRGDYLAIACGVFVATQLTLSSFILGASWITEYRLQGMWIVIIGLGLAACGLSTRTGAVVAWGAFTCAGGLAVAVVGYQLWTYKGFVPMVNAGGLGFEGVRQTIIVTALAVVLTIAGLVAFVRERRLS
jgi:hypothetical protein